VEEVIEDVEIVLVKILDDQLNTGEALVNNLVTLDSLRYNTTWTACERQILWSYNSSIPTASRPNCSYDECAQLYFDDFVRDRTQMEGGACKQDPRPLLIETALDITWYQNCKLKVFEGAVYRPRNMAIGRICDHDDDCIIKSVCNTTNHTNWCTGILRDCSDDSDCVVTSVCDQFRGVCNDTKTLAEELFWDCFFLDMTADVRDSLVYLNETEREDLLSFVEKFSSNMCVSHGGTGLDAYTHRLHYSYMSPASSGVTVLDPFGIEVDPDSYHCACADQIGASYDMCFDILCNLPTHCRFTAFDKASPSLLLPNEQVGKSSRCMFQIIPVRENEANCLAENHCNWDPYVAESIVRQQPLLNRSECLWNDGGFCGVRYDTNYPYYREVIDVTEDDCTRSKTVCVTPIGSIVLGINESECSSYGICSADCDHDLQCVPKDRFAPSICYNDSDAMTESLCRRYSGIWKTDWSASFACVFPLQNNPLECNRNGNKFYTCNSSVETCGENPWIDCVVSSRSACPMSKCTPDRGRCTDNDVFINYKTNPVSFESCVLPFVQNGLFDFCYVGTVPTSLG
jgi:hypothetical protein